jgi:ATP-binding cassette subfamily B protein
MKNFKIIKKYFQVTKANKKITLLLIIASLLTNGPYMFTSLLFSLSINYLAKKETDMVIVTISIYFMLKTASKIFKIVSYNIEKRLYNDVYRKLHDEIVGKLEIIDLRYFNTHSKGEILNIVNQDIKILAEFGTWLSNAILLFISFLISIIILARISIGLMVLGIIVNSVVIYILNIYNEKYEVLTKEGKLKADEEMQFYSELLTGLKDIKIFNILDNLRLKYKELNESYIVVHNKQINNQIISNIISPSITMGTEIILLCYACYNCLNGYFEIDTVLVIQSYFGMLFSSLSDFISTLGELRIKNVSIERYDNFVHSDMTVCFSDEKLAGIEDYGVELENVCFSYGKNQVLKELNLSIKSNSLNALVGDSGCGKSTLFNLLLRFEREYLGKILVGKYSIEEYSKDEYAKIMTCVSQQPYLFHMSIYDNLALINSDINKIREACKQAEIDDYIMSLPMKYDTVLEEAAINISGGQKQRIAIARALLKNSKILLCDEVTSALDEKTASGLFQTLTKLKDEHTIILISHKPHEYNQCENIIYL